MFKRILIANRGEIACRVIKTARRMGIETIAVYSEADRDALHVEMADDAVLIGPPAAAESYLLIEKIVEACRKTGAEAVHPGYGFLSEREAFPRALAEAGVVFIGPNASAIAGAVCGVTIRPRKPSGTNRMRLRGVLFWAKAVTAVSTVRPAESIAIFKRIKISPERQFRLVGRCLSLVFLYDGIVTSAPACQIAGWTLPQGCK